MTAIPNDEEPRMTSDARGLVHRFIASFNERDLDTLRELVDPGYEGLQALIDKARDVDLLLVPFRPATVDESGDHVRVRQPVRELIGRGRDDIERIAEFELRDGRITAFAMRPME
jgi:hypothetical protein